MLHSMGYLPPWSPENVAWHLLTAICLVEKTDVKSTSE